MMIMQTPQYWIKNITIIGVVAILAACGGGGSNSNSNSGGGNGTINPPPVELDLTPDSFAFVAKDEAIPGESYTSNAIAVSGIDAAVPVSITGGEYSIDSGDFTAATATVKPGQTIVVMATAAPTPISTVNAVLTIGGVKGTYSITTLADETAPTAEFMFPPPVSMTDGATVLARGIASDDYSEITAVTVNGNPVETTDNFATWQVEIPLVAGDNKLKVATTDSVGNISTNAAEVMVRQDAITEAFPDDVYEFDGVVDFVIDRLDGRNRLLTVSGADAVVTSVDLTTGKRTTVFDFKPYYTGANLWSVALNDGDGQIFFRDDSSSILSVPVMGGVPKVEYNNKDLGNMGFLTLDKTEEKPQVITVDSDRGNLVAVDLELPSFDVFSLSDDSPYSIRDSYGIAWDEERYLVTNSWTSSIVAIDRLTGEREMFSSNAENSLGALFTAPPEGALSGITIDNEKNRALVVEAITGKVFAINLDTRKRTLISDSSITNTGVVIDEAYGIRINSTNSYAFVANRSSKGIVAVDLVTGHRVVFSKSATTP